MPGNIERHYVGTSQLHIKFGNGDAVLIPVIFVKIEVDNHNNETITYYVISDTGIVTADEFAQNHNYDQWVVTCEGRICYKV